MNTFLFPTRLQDVYEYLQKAAKWLLFAYVFYYNPDYCGIIFSVSEIVQTKQMPF